MLPWGVIDDLLCPCCGSQLEKLMGLNETSDGLVDGVLRCECYEYPVVHGIAVLRQMSPVSSSRNEAVESIKRRDLEGALLWLLEKGSASGVPSLAELRAKARGWNCFPQRLRQMFRRSGQSLPGDAFPLGNGFEAALQSSRTKGYADYLFYRFANPSFLSAIAPLLVLGDNCMRASRRRVIDLMCGIGHTSSILVSLFPDLEVVGADSDFVNLFLARKFTAPGVVTLCIDAEVPLPFADASVDGLFCLDGFHYIRSKVALLRQVDRIVSDEGSWVFAHMHNALDANINPGTPLSPKGYSKRFVFGQQRLLSESEILGQFQAGGFLDLTEQAPIEAISSDNALTLIGARTDSMWRKHLAMDDLLFRRYDLLEFNPLYRVEVAKDELILRAKWPTESLRRECTGTTTPLPELVHLPFSTVEEVKLAKSSKQPSAGVRQLIRSFVLVVLPVCYARVDFQVHTVSTKEG